MINILPLLGVLNPLRGCGDNLDIDFIMKMSTTIYHWCNDVKISKNIYFCRLFYLGANCTLWGYNDNFSKTLFCPLGKEILYLVLLFTAFNITILDLNDFWGLLIILCGEGFYPLEGYNIFDLEKKIGGTYSSMQAGKYGLSKVKIRGIFFQQIFGGHLEFWKSQAEGNFPYNRNWVFRHRSIILCKKIQGIRHCKVRSTAAWLIIL